MENQEFDAEATPNELEVLRRYHFLPKKRKAKKKVEPKADVKKKDEKKDKDD
jgi:hypothetical protein